MDEKRFSLQIFVCILLSFPVLLFAENLTVTPAKCFLQEKLIITLKWRYHSEELKEKHFDKDFVFFHDGTKLQNEGGGATMVIPGKPYVDYELVIRKPGSYVGKVESVNTTALVYTVKSEANTTSAARSRSDLNLTCVGGPEGTVILWEVDGVPVDHEKYRENNDGSLTAKKIDLPDALRKFGCRMFFTIDDREEYKKNKSNVLGYKTAVVYIAVLVYNTSRHSESESLFILQVATLKDGITVCGQKNSSDFCERIGVNISSVELDKSSNFTIHMNHHLLVTDHFRVSDEPVHIKQPQDSDGPSLKAIAGIAGGIVAGIVLIVAIVIFFFRKKKKNDDEVGVELNQTREHLMQDEQDTHPKATDKEDEQDTHPKATDKLVEISESPETANSESTGSSPVKRDLLDGKTSAKAKHASDHTPTNMEPGEGDSPRKRKRPDGNKGIMGRIRKKLQKKDTSGADMKKMIKPSEPVEMSELPETANSDSTGSSPVKRDLLDGKTSAKAKHASDHTPTNMEPGEGDSPRKRKRPDGNKGIMGRIRKKLQKKDTSGADMKKMIKPSEPTDVVVSAKADSIEILNEGQGHSPDVGQNPSFL